MLDATSTAESTRGNCRVTSVGWVWVCGCVVVEMGREVLVDAVREIAEVRDELLVLVVREIASTSNEDGANARRLEGLDVFWRLNSGILSNLSPGVSSGVCGR